MAPTCADMVSSESRTMPRSRAVLTVETDAFNIGTAWTSGCVENQNSVWIQFTRFSDRNRMQSAIQIKSE